ncbi:MAG: hypothetical protein H7A23_12715 [Leptospiraceae bacterium]|nr:hypothetical protein [Leptospiraceae bacterium]MCP5495412.1 hypothetical protein [Leptospiraceae bacterium]
MTIIDQITLPIFIFWGIGLILVFFRRDLDLLWKSLFLLIYAFYILQFFPEILLGYQRLVGNYPKEIVSWIKGIGKVFYYFLLIVWPVLLVRVFYSASGYLSFLTIRLMVFATFLYWVLFYCFVFFSAEINNFFNITLIRFLTL